MRHFTLLLMLLFGMSTSTFSQDFFINDDFRDALVADGVVDTDNDGYISQLEARAITEIDVENEKLTDLTGINKFINVKILKCSYNYLSSLDLSGLVLLEELHCFQNRLTSINVKSNPNLKYLFCFENKLTSLDISNNNNLQNLQCYKNKLTSLNLDNKTELTHVDCSWNVISELDLTSSTKLDYLACGANNISFLKLMNNTELNFLACSSNSLTTLDLTNCRRLNEIYTTENPHLKSICVWNISEAENNSLFYRDGWVDLVTDCALNFKGSTFKNALVTQGYDPNRDGYIRQSEVAGVKILNINGDPFGKTNNQKILNIDGIEGFTNLINLSMAYNEVKKMDVSKNSKLQVLTCNNNRLEGLDISKNTSITSLKCTNNNISIIYVWDLDFVEGNSRFRKDASAVWAIHGQSLKLMNYDMLESEVYPIPANEFIMIESAQDAVVTIYNLLGIAVLSNLKINKGLNKLDLDLKPDLYLVKIKSANKSTVRQIIIE